MCGIVGILGGSDVRGRMQPDALVRDMAATLLHRGPDDGGSWVDAERGIALGHRRLAVVDLSPLGHQPMASASGRMVLVYNGEVYNHRELRAELEALGHTFRSACDTEVIVEGCERWGVEALARKLIGMFAFALWDRQDRTLHLVRDRLGIKPLYWARFGDAVLFASELKALRAHPAFDAEIDPAALAAFLRHGYVPAPRSIYRGVEKVRQGSILTFARGAAPALSLFWSMERIVRDALSRRRDDLGEAEAEAQLDSLLRDAVGRRMIADVPLGAFLSGGIDSSTVVSLMQAQSTRPVKTFSIGFAEAGFDEAVYAKAVAAHLGTDHTELYVEPSQALDVIPRLPEIYDEPFADASQIPTYLVSALTRRHVTVALSGDGGDELFAGYDRYARVRTRWDQVSAVPAPMRSAAARMLRGVPAPAWDAICRYSPAGLKLPFRIEQLDRLAHGVSDGFGEFYRQSVSHWPRPASLVRRRADETDGSAGGWTAPGIDDPVEQMQYLDSVTYLPDDILVKLDRASMAVSLEARVPLLDHRVVEFAWSLPRRFKSANREPKWLLREVLARYVPRALFERPKMGFGVPVHAWLRGPLRDWAEDLLDERRLRDEGYLEPAPIRRKWAQHLGGGLDWSAQLWSVLMFQSWLAASNRRGSVSADDLERRACVE